MSYQLDEEQARELGWALYPIPYGRFNAGPCFLMAYALNDGCSEEWAIELPTEAECLDEFSDFVAFAYEVHPFKGRK